MTSTPSRKKRKPRLFDVLLVPVGEGNQTHALRGSVAKLVILASAFVLLVAAFVYVVLVYSPIAVYVPIPNAALERQYGAQIAVQEVELKKLVTDVETLKDYNAQLRKALGEGATGDTLTSRGAMPAVETEPGGNSSGQIEQSKQPDKPQEDLGTSLDEGTGSVELGSSAGGVYSVVTSESQGKELFPLMMPVDGVVSQSFEPGMSHFGIDFAGKRGTTVIAPAEGHVVFAGWTFDDGNMLIIAHDGGYMTVYKHNQSLLTTTQSFVRRGEPIALLGETGQTSLGPHLHFEVWRNGTPRDPAAYLITTGATQ
jgi:murein DD-endopeptidase MepM/ murein hydrolase activator NlpD